MGATLWAGPESAVSHRSAAALWKLDGIEAGGVVELTTARCRNPDVPKGITLHRSKLLTSSDAGWLGALRVTGLARTLIDPWLVGRSEGAGHEWTGKASRGE